MCLDHDELYCYLISNYQTLSSYLISSGLTKNKNFYDEFKNC